MRGNCSRSYLFKLFELPVNIVLNGVTLGQLHFPLTHIVNRLIVVVHQVAAHERTVTHVHDVLLCLCALANLVVRERCILLAVSRIVLILAVASVTARHLPMIMRSRVNHSARIQLTEHVGQLATERLVERLPALGVRQIQRVEDGLRDNVVEVLEELVLGLLVLLAIVLRVLNEHEADEVCGHSIQQELLMIFEFLLRVAYGANDVPEGV